jgi:hypothetical protein
MDAVSSASPSETRALIQEAAARWTRFERCLYNMTQRCRSSDNRESESFINMYVFLFTLWRRECSD